MRPINFLVAVYSIALMLVGSETCIAVPMFRCASAIDSLVFTAAGCVFVLVFTCCMVFIATGIYRSTIGHRIIIPDIFFYFFIGEMCIILDAAIKAVNLVFMYDGVVDNPLIIGGGVARGLLICLVYVLYKSILHKNNQSLRPRRVRARRVHAMVATRMHRTETV